MDATSEKELLSSFAGKRILTIGDVMLDEYVTGKVRRVSPEAPVPVIEFEDRSFRPGGAANTAANVASLQGVAILGGVVGNDWQSTQLREVLDSQGIDLSGVFSLPGRRTTTKTRLLAHQQQIARIDYECREPLPPSTEGELLDWAERQMPGCDVCVLSDYAKGLISQRLAEEVIRLAARQRKPVLVDPKGRDFRKYRCATLVKPNLHEVERLLNQEIGEDEDALEQAGRYLLDLLEGSALLITRGQRGMSLFRRESRTVHVPSLARNVYDVTGAGDTVAATLALSLAANAPLELAASLANRAAGIVVSKVGTAQVTQDELLAGKLWISGGETAGVDEFESLSVVRRA